MRAPQAAASPGDEEGSAGEGGAPAGGEEPADSAPWGSARGDPREEAASLIRLRLQNPGSATAATMSLRPQLQVSDAP